MYALEESTWTSMPLCSTSAGRSSRKRKGEAPQLGSPENGQERTVHLSPGAVVTIRAHLAQRRADKLRKGRRDLPVPLFASKAGTYADQSNGDHVPVCVKAGLPHRSPPDLRHTYASLHPQAGTDIAWVSRQLGP